MGQMPAVFVCGPRQAGKSTLVQRIAKDEIGAGYVTFDDLSAVAAAKEDPAGFIRRLPKPVVLDEIQMVPEVFRAIKQDIDESRLDDQRPSNGRFLLTGSVSVMALPQLSEALVGRMLVQTLLPLSAGEVTGVREGFLEQLFRTHGDPPSEFPHEPVDSMIRQATYAQLAANPGLDRTQWFDAYLTTLLQRDVRAMAEIEKVVDLPKMLRLIAARSGAVLNESSLATDAAMNTMTHRRYRALLERLFLLHTVAAWFGNIGKRLVKAPKLYLYDTPMLCHLMGMHLGDLRDKRPELYGRVLENFVASELQKQLDYCDLGTLYHFRTHDQKEIDFIVEHRDGRLAAIEVKSRATLRNDDFRPMKQLKSLLGEALVAGVVVYTGEQVIPFGNHFWAMPISALWRWGAKSIVASFGTVMSRR